MKLLTKLLSHRKNILPYVFFACLSLAPFFWKSSNAIYPLAGSCDFSSPVDLAYEIGNHLFVYDPLHTAGYESTPQLSTLFPYHVIMWVLSQLHVSPHFSVLFFISLLLFLSQVSMFQFLQEYLVHSLNLKKHRTFFWSFIGAELYGFSPYPIGLIAPGHFLSLVLYALFPWILLFYVHILEEQNISYKKVLLLFLLFFSSVSGAAYSISVPYILAIIFSAYALFSILLSRIPSVRTVKRYILVFILMILACSWWLIPFLVTQFFSHAQYETNPLMSGVVAATGFSTIGNIFLGRAEGQLYDTPSYFGYFRFPLPLLFLLMTVFLGYALFQRQRNPGIRIFFGLLLLGVFISKGVREPWGNMFQFLYEHIPGFQIFRRPVSKFYWEFFFFYISLSMMGLAFFEERMARFRTVLRVTAGIVFGGCIGWLVYSFIFAGGLTSFHIPDYYVDAGNRLKMEKATRILLLPGTYGVYPKFNQSMNGYSGIDFIYELWKVPVISPDPTGYSVDLPYKKQTNTLMRLIREGQSFCTKAGELGISHIVVRTDYADETKIEIPQSSIISILDASFDIQSKEILGQEKSGIYMYGVKDTCRSDLVSLADEDPSLSFEYERENPVQIRIRISGFSDTVSLVLLENYSRWWKLYPIPQKSYGKSIIFRKGIQIPDHNHNILYGWANSWDLDPEYLKKTYSKEFVEELPNGKLRMSFLLYFQPQLSYYAGIFLTAVAGGTVLWIYVKSRKYEKSKV
ncbi:MAG: hypothetical protein UV63_C0001G0067 [Microgenomates group bacterium GW2011_GWC1_43_11]|uniref:Membrane protein 6-pyruvoyl-tetrahydropterin synthase-related domain-containing protein n=2 Tax=Candidatus Gottesmaniibacteriota TaxID=1752720 RepID=A0A0G1LP14_9BACT|nr:MAG: hypothetical protein UV63_C0001G0067 [Microgenomates group bacterium GW2011_GWC1_43_11]KKT39156.1 MAG: hypothetical protein UW22_C0001G0067 [Candidatus Gottesmanbacteria bacterium GW2011_GWB1_44_11c]KKT61629.1 MAG: hypothetical protein UW52_C0001G0067 [Candidatus Gottesmanbacteria bacterium GW2011_GWA1_44_24b]HCM82174.1 hypothetical protein [Patescibacteria group bacterium]